MRTVGVCVLLVGVIFLFKGNQAEAKVTINDITSESIEQMEQAINDAETQRQQLEANLTNIQSLLSELQITKSNLASYISQLDSSLATIEENLTNLEALIAEKESQVEITSQQLQEANQVANDQYKAMCTRIQFMYERGDQFYLEMVFGAESFGDFLNKAEYIKMLSEYDRNMLTEYEKTVATIKTMEEMLLSEQETLEEAKADVVVEQDALLTLITQKQDQITAYEEDIDNKQVAIAEYEAEIEEQDALIAQLETAVTEERKAIALAQGYVLSYDGSRFTWPAPSYSRISCEYGWRIHPTLKVEQFHNGVDMAAPTGTSILAAYSGVVASAGYTSTMGNYVMIDHGSGLFTIYMHAQQLFVSTDELVMRGEKIATVGSTGRSTGPHLHFGVRLNGAYVSPWNYLQ